jgi:hypothetical protein
MLTLEEFDQFMATVENRYRVEWLEHQGSAVPELHAVS